MYGYGYRYNSGLVIGAGGGAPFANTSSLSFDGVDDYLNLGRVTSLEGATNFSLSMWVKPTSYAGLHMLFGRFFSGTDFIYAYTDNVFGYIYFSISNGQTSYPRVNTSSRIDLNTWGLLTFVYDGAEVGNLNKAKIYINGVLAATTTTAALIPSSLSTDTTDFQIAQRSGLPNTPMAGGIDEVSLYDYSLSASEVTDIYNLGTPTDLSLLATPPLHWYRNGDNGSWKSPQWLIPNNENFAANKVSNYSFDFDGVDDYINCGNDSTLNIYEDITISAWLKADSFGAYNLVIGRAIRKDYDLGVYSVSGGGAIRFHTGDGVQENAVSTGTILSTGVWYHIAIVRTITPNQVTFFINGQELNTASLSKTPIGSTDITRIGSRSGSFVFDGDLSNIAIWNSALSSSQITDIYNGGRPTTISGAVSSWKLGEDSTFSGGVWTVPDNVGSNDGTSANMTIEDRIGEAPNSTNNALSFNMDEVDRVTDVPT
jgi:hypothetical protein